ncbi:hypothetical protein NUSPORA_02830 [Nucleospora cyclopteri]
MKKIEKDKPRVKELLELNQYIESLNKELKEVDTEIFKKETVYLMKTKNNPITKDCENYLNLKSEKKSSEIKNTDRIFSMNYPK